MCNLILSNETFDMQCLKLYYHGKNTVCATTIYTQQHNLFYSISKIFIYITRASLFPWTTFYDDISLIFHLSWKTNFDIRFYYFQFFVNEFKFKLTKKRAFNLFSYLGHFVFHWEFTFLYEHFIHHKNFLIQTTRIPFDYQKKTQNLFF